MKLKTIFFLICAISINCQSQDPFFGQFQHASLLLNPALAGTLCGDRFSFNYRKQWTNFLADGYHTLFAAYDRPFNLKNGDRIGVGTHFLLEKAGESKLRNLVASLVFSYQKVFNSDETTHYLIGGLQAGGAHKVIIDFENLQWGSQHDGNGGFDPTIASSEEFQDRFAYLDIGGGVAWRTVFSNQNSFNLGVALHHFNRPNQSLRENPTNAEKLYIRYVIHGAADIKISPKIGLAPRFFIYDQGPSFQTTITSGIKFHFNNVSQNVFELGGGIRMSNHFQRSLAISAIITSLNYEMSDFIFGISTEFDQSTIRPASDGFGAVELAVIYKFCR